MKIIGDSRDPGQTLIPKDRWVAALEWLRTLYRSEAASAASVDSASLARALRASESADQLARARDYESSVLLYEQATQQVLDMAGQGHSSVLAVHAAHADDNEPGSELPAAVRLARARLRAVVAHEFGDLNRQTSQRLRHLAQRSLFVVGLCLLVSLASSLWRQWGERDLAAGADWTLSSAPAGSPKSGKLTPLRWLGDHPSHLIHSDITEPPNVTVDLRGPHLITRVAVTNRLDCCYERAIGLELWTSLDGVAFSRVPSEAPARPFRFFTFQFPARRARFVRLSLPKPQYLHLAELKVYGK